MVQQCKTCCFVRGISEHGSRLFRFVQHFPLHKQQFQGIFPIEMNERLYLLRIKLLNAEPKIWRRFVVPASIALDDLHNAIQIVMGWEDYHLYQFMINRQGYTTEPESEEELDSSKYHLGDLIQQKSEKFRYMYDFGDDWVHEIVVQDVDYSNPKLGAKPVCLEGEGACPPEDVGGVYGYLEFCKAMKDPSHSEHEEWIGSDWDSEKFDIDAVNKQLSKSFS